MKIIGIDDGEEINKKLNKKKTVITVAIITIMTIIIILASAYITNRKFREFIDIHILRKTVTENNLTSIQIDEQHNNIYAYDKYIVVLKNNSLIHYTSSGKEDNKIDVQITNPIVDVNNKYLIIGEKDKQKLYLISSGNKAWEKEIEGNISRVSVNKNGYCAVIISGTSYKSVIQVFDNTGKSIFKTYLSSTIAMDVDISNDNKYMSFAEISTSGTVVNSKVKTVSIEKATIDTYASRNNSLLLKIKYQDQNRLVCMYDNAITVIHGEKEEEITNLEENKKTSFADIRLSNYAVKVIEKSSFLKSENDIEIINISNKKTNLYILDGVAKEIYCFDSNIAINLGTEVHFIGTNGWLIKKYTSNQEVKNIVMCDNFAGIVYRNKIEIVSL